ncbi:unnamed protein product [Rhizoctonia solani]|uniref:DNA polymerase delta subunit 3 n=1 Tax=Rhizoctonia solani TaxID=456999 RepID=A0A8H2X1T7_9AGAM|nr:unnamed protein product [Rhizoctonia solani]
MDIDDDNVVNGRSTRETTPEHVPSAREVAAAAKAAKIEASKGVDQKERKSHRRVPKGKKRVMKTRRVKNAKGYMVAEDYSSYEDADPNDIENGEDSDAQSETDYGDDLDVDVSGKLGTSLTDPFADDVVNGRSTREATPEHVPSAREAAAAAKAAKIEASKGVDHKERKSHKRVPKGKKRVMKTRRVKNAKGYMVTEDYSSYEDADPNDSEKSADTDAHSETDYGDDIDVDVSGKVVSTKPPKPAAKAPASKPKRQQSNSLPNAKPKKGKSDDASKPGQQKLASFFGKKP